MSDWVAWRRGKGDMQEQNMCAWIFFSFLFM